MQKLREAYFPRDTTNISAIELGNIDFLSDSAFCDSIIKATILQTIANNNGIDRTAHRNTFIFRFDYRDSENSLFNYSNQQLNSRLK